MAYLYAPDRKAEHPIRHLAGFKGTLQVDGYAGYKVLAVRNGVSLTFCWAHVRRRFYELAKAGPAPIASEALARIAELYRIEGEIRGRTPDERRDVRQDRSRPVMAALEPWLTAKLGLISQKSKLAEAIRYAFSRWIGLSRFLDDGRVEIDNNMVERVILPRALTRKNALLAGLDGGAGHWAVVASLVETCKLNGVEPLTYLTDVIARIVAGHPQRGLDDLLAWAYAPQPPLDPWHDDDAYDQVGFAVHPRRWVVERFFGWISRNRRHWKDPEATLASAKAFLYPATVMILVRRLSRAS